MTFRIFMEGEAPRGVLEKEGRVEVRCHGTLVVFLRTSTGPKSHVYNIGRGASLCSSKRDLFRGTWSATDVCKRCAKHVERLQGWEILEADESVERDNTEMQNALHALETCLLYGKTLGGSTLIEQEVPPLIRI
jgi:hypothetical protein